VRQPSLTVLLTVAIMASLTGPAAAQYPPVPEDGVEISDATLVPGEEFTVSGSGWEPGSTVDFTLFSTPADLGSAEVADDTAFSTTLEIPEDVEPGTHTLETAGTSDEGDPRTVELTVEVLAAGSDVDGVQEASNLASTGANLTVGVGLGIALLVAGALTLVVSRRRRARVLIDQ